MSGISTSLEHASTILIDYTALKRNTRVLNPDLIAPAKEEVINETVIDRTSEPIKSMDDIIAISRYLITHGRFRDLCKMLGVKNGYTKMYEDEINRLKVEKPEYDGDEEDLLIESYSAGDDDDKS